MADDHAHLFIVLVPRVTENAAILNARLCGNWHQSQPDIQRAVAIRTRWRNLFSDRGGDPRSGTSQLAETSKQSPPGAMKYPG
jgi:hypothetical protein